MDAATTGFCYKQRKQCKRNSKRCAMNRHRHAHDIHAYKVPREQSRCPRLGIVCQVGGGANRKHGELAQDRIPNAPSRIA